MINDGGTDLDDKARTPEPFAVLKDFTDELHRRGHFGNTTRASACRYNLGLVPEKQVHNQDQNQPAGRRQHLSALFRRLTLPTLLSGSVLLLGLGIGLSFRPAAPPPPQMVLGRVQELLQLETTIYRYRDVVYVGEQRTVLGFRTVDRSVLLGVDIEVVAGIPDVEQIQLVPIRGSRRGVLVRMPEPVILRSDADEASVREYISATRGGPVSPLLVGDEIENAKQRLEADAIERGALEDARAAAERAVESLLNLLGYESVEFQLLREQIRG